MYRWLPAYSDRAFEHVFEKIVGDYTTQLERSMLATLDDASLVVVRESETCGDGGGGGDDIRVK
ncbi:hypothetical protein BT69DRAFT_1290449 [Atractiella rhizophila]|nr:hypothetical protein BT69DRAFT_1290449 [Atractiella rhizophila]